MSHAKNVEAFGKLVGVCTGYGENYNPGQPNLRVESLSNLFTTAHTALINVNLAKTALENATNGREVAHREINFLAARILSELKSSGALPQTVADARTMVRKIKGYSPDRPPAQAAGVSPGGAAARGHTSGSDYSSAMYHFDKLLTTVSAEPMYKPLLPVLRVENLRAKLATLRGKNEEVSAASAAVGKARRERNTLLYGPADSLYHTAMAVKQQVRATFGHFTQSAKAATHIKFSKVKVKV